MYSRTSEKRYYIREQVFSQRIKKKNKDYFSLTRPTYDDELKTAYQPKVDKIQIYQL